MTKGIVLTEAQTEEAIRLLRRWSRPWYGPPEPPFKFETGTQWSLWSDFAGPIVAAQELLTELGAEAEDWTWPR